MAIYINHVYIIRYSCNHVAHIIILVLPHYLVHVMHHCAQ